MAEEQRRIELQSQEDLEYLITNVKRAAQERIDKDLPPIEGEDAMRNLVEEIVDDYISKTFYSASLNISINGMPPSENLLSAALSKDSFKDGNIVEEKEEHEPFDAKLWERAKALAIKEEELVEQIAALRRNVPGKVVEREGAWKKAVEEDERLIEERGKLGKDEDGIVVVGKGKLDRQDDVKADWEKAVTGLEGLERKLPEVGARKERAAKAEEYLRGVGRKG